MEAAGIEPATTHEESQANAAFVIKAVFVEAEPA
ncbi:hypothetical protein SAMN05443639_12770, partial [Stigmatella erecta]